jgi:hypothetical protein
LVIAALLALMSAAQVASAQSMPSPGAPLARTAAAPHTGVPAPAADIRDIRGPKPLPSPWLIPLIAAAVLAAAGGAYAAWTWNRRRSRQPAKQPLDIALERLDQARLLMVARRGREFSIEVSSAVRDFIESRFDLRAAHLTTDEFLHRLVEPADALLAAHRSLLDHFLQTCDLAKFGGWNLAANDMEAMWESARQFIVESADDGKPHPAQAATNRPVDRRPNSASRETYVSLPST